MELKIEINRFGGQDLYSVICTDRGQDRLVIQTSDRILAREVREHGWTDGTQIPSDVMERSYHKKSPQIPPKNQR